MAIYKYFSTVDALPSSCVPNVCPETIQLVNNQIQKTQEKGEKRGKYQKLLFEEKAIIAKYANENGVARAVKHFKEKNLKSSSVSDWKKLYEKELRGKRKFAVCGEEVTVPSLPTKKRGRPPLLGGNVTFY